LHNADVLPKVGNSKAATWERCALDMQVPQWFELRDQACLAQGCSWDYHSQFCHRRVAELCTGLMWATVFCILK